MAVDERRIAILGAGQIGEALLAGLLSTGWREPDEIVATVRREERAQELAERHGVRATTSNTEAVNGAAMIVIAVKPQDFDTLLGEIGGILSPEQTVLSIAAASRPRRSRSGSPPVSRCCARCRTRRRRFTKVLPGSAPGACGRRAPGARGGRPRARRPRRAGAGALHGRRHGVSRARAPRTSRCWPRR